MKLVLTPSTLALLAIEAAQRSAGVFPRQPWLLKALVEELHSSLPARSASGRAARHFWNPQRGVSERTLSRVIEELVQGEFLEPVGTGRDAAWRVPALKTKAVGALQKALTSAERRALRGAVQRTLAISVAWSKTRCA